MICEKRLIDADALDKRLDELMVRYKALDRDEVVEDFNFVRTVLLTAPTVDAVEVAHGYKVVKERIRGIAYTMHCPICNAPIPSIKPYAEKVDYCSVCGKRLDDTFQNYCPNCGAKMDMEEKKEWQKN